MKRREFLQTSAAMTAALGPVFAARAADGMKPPAREFYELRCYHLRRGPMQARLDEYARDVAIPAMNRAGVRPVGVFDVMFGPDMPSKYVLLPYRSLDHFLEAGAQMRGDPAVQQAAFTNLPAGDPGFVRVESSLMIAFEGVPKLEVPKQAVSSAPRIFELRTYESHSRKAAKKKVEMFNIGETAIFRRTGLTPVFFGETLIGPRMPNLIYLLVFADLAERERNWDRFRNDPEWKKLSATPGYTDPEIVSNISNVFLRPAAYSQV
jgi:hypothetical protein